MCEVAEGGISLLKGLFEKNKTIQKGLLLAESAVGLAKIVVSTQAANAADTAAAALMGPAGVGYLATKIPLNYASAAIGAAANIAATAKALSALGGGGAASKPAMGGGRLFDAIFQYERHYRLTRIVNGDALNSASSSDFVRLLMPRWYNVAQVCNRASFMRYGSASPSEPYSKQSIALAVQTFVVCVLERKGGEA